MTEALNKTATFLMGFTLLFPLRVAMSCAKYALVRFQLPDDKLSLFINLLHNPMELTCLIGIAISNIFIWCTPKYNKIHEHISVATNWLIEGGETGYLTFYYWTLNMFTFVYGINLTFSLKVDSKNASLATAGLPLSGCFVCIYHYIFLGIAEKYGCQNIEYRIVAIQIIISIILSLISAIVWTWARYGESADEEKKEEEENEGSIIELFKYPRFWSPVLMCIFTAGFTYLFYPAIAPYKLIETTTAYKIDLLAVFIYALPPLTISILDIYGIGPGKRWDGRNVLWNLMWLLGLFAFICMILFTVTLHYPEGSVAKSIKDNPGLVGFLSIGFVTCQETLKTCGFSGAGKQADDRSDIELISRDLQIVVPTGDGKRKITRSNGAVTAVCLFFGNSLMNLTMFISDGYLKEYEASNVEDWPTNGMSGWSAFWYWIGQGSHRGAIALKNTMTSDVRTTFLTLAA